MAGRLCSYAGHDGRGFLFSVRLPCSVADALGDAGFSKAGRGRLAARGQVGVVHGGHLPSEFSSGHPSSDGVARPPAAPLPAASLPAALPARLVPGDLLVIRPLVTREAGPASFEHVRVLWRDDFALAVDKPQGLLVHGDGTGAPTLTACVQGLLVREATAGEPCPVPQALQRLDVDTSGIVLFSLTEEFQPHFDALVAGDGMRKTYLAVVRGAFDRARCDVDAPIGRDRHDARRMRVSPGGQAALTHVRRLAVTPDGRHSLLAVTLGTGRRHQIRVHLAHLGFPIQNDPLYGRVETSGGLMLHAVREELAHPVTGARVLVDAGWPERFSAWFDGALWDGVAGDRAR